MSWAGAIAPNHGCEYDHDGKLLVQLVCSRCKDNYCMTERKGCVPEGDSCIYDMPGDPGPGRKSFARARPKTAQLPAPPVRTKMPPGRGTRPEAAPGGDWECTRCDTEQFPNQCQFWEQVAPPPTPVPAPTPAPTTPPLPPLPPQARGAARQAGLCGVCGLRHARRSPRLPPLHAVRVGLLPDQRYLRPEGRVVRDGRLRRGVV